MFIISGEIHLSALILLVERLEGYQPCRKLALNLNPIKVLLGPTRQSLEQLSKKWKLS